MSRTSTPPWQQPDCIVWLNPQHLRGSRGVRPSLSLPIWDEDDQGTIQRVRLDEWVACDVLDDDEGSICFLPASQLMPPSR